MRSSRSDSATRPPPPVDPAAGSAGRSSTATGCAEAKEGGEGGHQPRAPGLPGSPLCSLLPCNAAAAGVLGESPLSCCWVASLPLLDVGCSSWDAAPAAAAATAGSSTDAQPMSSLPPLVLAGVLAPLRPAASQSASSFRSLSPPPMVLLSGLSSGPAPAAPASPAAEAPLSAASASSAASAKPISPSRSASCSAGPAADAAPVLLLLLLSLLLLLAPCTPRRSTVTGGRRGGCSATAAELAVSSPPCCCSPAPGCSATAGGVGGGGATARCCCRWRGCLAASCACCCCRQATKCVRPLIQAAEKRCPGGGPTCSRGGADGPNYTSCIEKAAVNQPSGVSDSSKHAKIRTLQRCSDKCWHLRHATAAPATPTHLEDPLFFLPVISHCFLAPTKQFAASQPAVRHGITAGAAAGCSGATALHRSPAPAKGTRGSRADGCGGRAAALPSAWALWRRGCVPQSWPAPAAASVESRGSAATPGSEAAACAAGRWGRRRRAKAAASPWRSPATPAFLQGCEHWWLVAREGRGMESANRCLPASRRQRRWSPGEGLCGSLAIWIACK